MTHLFQSLKLLVLAVSSVCIPLQALAQEQNWPKVPDLQKNVVIPKSQSAQRKRQPEFVAANPPIKNIQALPPRTSQFQPQPKRPNPGRPIQRNVVPLREPYRVSGSSSVAQSNMVLQHLTQSQKPAPNPIQRPPTAILNPQNQVRQNQVQQAKTKKPVETVIDSTLGQWWTRGATTPFSKNSELVSPEALIVAALKSSPKLRAISRDPLIREFAIDEARSRFDPEFFVKSRFDDKRDPIGNQLQLTNDGNAFLKENIWSAESGFRKKLLTGADVDISQRIGFQNSNSRFFDPQDQGTSTLFLNFSQPLLRGKGRVYNRSQIVIAELNTDVAWEQYVGELQTELEAIINAYWNLYFVRSVWMQKNRAVDRGQKILNILEKRRNLDSVPSQIARARAAVMIRRTELANARRDIQNAQTELRRLLGVAQVNPNSTELVPVEIPRVVFVKPTIQNVSADALEMRPEVKEAFRRAKIASVQLSVSENELLPELSLSLGMYYSALDGDSGIFRSLQNQYSDTIPGYYAGIEFKYPVRNRAARSRFTQSRLRLAKIQDEIAQISQTVIAESQKAVRRFESAFETLQSSAEAISAAEEDLKQQRKRWESFGLVEGDLTEGQNPTTILDQLLDAQQRLTNAELTFSRAELEFKSSEIELRRVSGTLLQQQNIGFSRTQSNSNVPSVNAVQLGSENGGQIQSFQRQVPTLPNSMNNHSEVAPPLPNQAPAELQRSNQRQKFPR